MYVQLKCILGLPTTAAACNVAVFENRQPEPLPRFLI